MRFHIDYHCDRNDQIFLSNMELRNLTDQNFRDIKALRRAYEAELESILADGRDTGAFSLPDVRVGTMALLAMLNGVVSWYREGGRLSREKLQRVYLDMALRMVMA